MPNKKDETHRNHGASFTRQKKCLMMIRVNAIVWKAAEERIGISKAFTRSDGNLLPSFSLSRKQVKQVENWRVLGALYRPVGACSF